MSQITISSHDFLEKLSAVKNYLSIVIAGEKNMDPKHIEYLKNAADANQLLIDDIKLLNPKGLKSSIYGKDINY